MSNQQTTPPKKTDPDLSRETILIVDDTPANLRVLSRMLIKRGYKVCAAINGARALEAVQANLPNLILLDIMMPNMDGYEVCRRLKAGEQSRDIPVIFISALNETKNKLEAFTAGGVDYVTKPFQAKEVLARVETHLALRRLQKSLQQEIAELDSFAHTVAHDLKNPLCNIIGYADLLSESIEAGDKMPEKNLLFVMQIVKGAQKMDSIIKSLLLLAGVRKQKVEFKSLDMANIILEIQHRLAAMIQKYQAEIILPDSWPTVRGYGPWVEEIWANYISNAIKYGGQPPRLEVGATVQDDGAVRCWVRDNGSGLSPEEQVRLFTPFERLGQVQLEGHGLGLSIAIRIAEKLGGRVGVESELGQGSVFWFILPGE